MKMEPLSKYSIGMFDSGIGGLTVLEEIQKKLPLEHVIYFGDTARLPYGDKSAATVLRYSIENSIFLMDQGIKVLVIACNTASSVAVDKLKKIFNLPVIGTIEPGAFEAVRCSKNGKIGVLGTKGTIDSGAFQREIVKQDSSALVVPIACPLFVPFIEEGFHTHPAAKLIIDEYLAPLKKEKIDTLLLGCTHYPALMPYIKDYLGESVTIIDSATTCATKVKDLLKEKGLENKEINISPNKFFVSDNPEKFRRLGQMFISTPLPEAALIPASF